MKMYHWLHKILNYKFHDHASGFLIESGNPMYVKLQQSTKAIIFPCKIHLPPLLLQDMVHNSLRQLDKHMVLSDEIDKQKINSNGKNK